MQRTFLYAVLLAIGMNIQTNARAAVDTYLKLDGIDGESTAQGHEKWIEVESFSFGASHLANGQTQLSEVVITQPIDSSSPQEFAALVGGKPITTGILDLVKAGSDPQKLFEYTFSDILLSSITFSGSFGGNPVETLTFDYSKIKLQAFAQNDQGETIPLPPVEFNLGSVGNVPEPSTWVLLACGLLAVAMRGSRVLRRSHS